MEYRTDQRLDLSCFKCGKTLENATRTSDGLAMNQNQPSEGLAFMSHGAYGSTVFDPMDGHFLEINICDLCLLKAIPDGTIAIGKDWRNIREANPTGRIAAITGSERIPREELQPLRLWQGVRDPDEEDEGAVYR
jgi:hypothetical protein